MPRFIPTRRGPQPRMVTKEEIVKSEMVPVQGLHQSYRTRGASQTNNRNKGDFTGAQKPNHPKVFRKFSNNTRQLVGYKHTGVWDNQYEAEIVQSRSVPAFIPAGAVLAQSGAPSILHGISALKAGPNHWLFHG